MESKAILGGLFAALLALLAWLTGNRSESTNSHYRALTLTTEH